jgi:uncharacterized protein (TIGR02246 family)
VDDIEAIAQLKARYCRTMDTKDWPSFREVFTADVTVDTTESDGGVIHGAGEFVEFLRGVLGDVVTVHHCHMPEITILSPTEATGVWAMEDELWWPDGMHLHGYGHYHERYTRADGVWRIAATKLTRLRRDLTTAGGEPIG